MSCYFAHSLKLFHIFPCHSILQTGKSVTKHTHIATALTCNFTHCLVMLLYILPRATLNTALSYFTHYLDTLTHCLDMRLYTMPCHAVLHIALSCYFTLCLVTIVHTLPCHVILQFTLSCYFAYCLVMLFYTLPCQAILYTALSCCFTHCLVMS